MPFASILTRPRSLSRLLSFYVGGGVFLLAAIFAVAMQILVSQFLNDALHDKAQALARQLAIVVLDSVLVKDYGSIERYVTEVARQRDVIHVRVERRDGEILGEATSDVIAAAERPRDVSQDIVLLNRHIGAVSISYDAGRVERLVNRLAVGGFAAVFSVALLLFVMVRWLIHKRVIVPIRHLAQQVSPLTASSDDLPAGDAGIDEIRQIAEPFQQLRREIVEHIRRLEQANQLTRAATERLCREQRLATVGQLAAGLAHGLNTPLGNIIGYAQMARRQSGDHKLAGRLEVIERQAESCAAIVRNLMTVAHKPDPVGTAVDAVDIIRGVVQLVRPLLTDHGISSVVISGETACPAWSDPSALEQVLFNLLSNAAHAGASHLQLDVRRQDGRVELRVIDNGPGIPEAIRATLFEPFSTTKPAGEGTGLGLYICSTLLEALNGSIVLEDSRPGRTAFRVCLPTAPRPTATTEGDASCRIVC